MTPRSKRNINRGHLIFCEGKTEATFVKALTSRGLTRRHIQCIPCNGGECNRIGNTITTKLEKDPNIDRDDYRWLLIDGDRLANEDSNRAEAFWNCLSKEVIRPVISYPSFEAGLICTIEIPKGLTTANDAKKRLRTVLSGFDGTEERKYAKVLDSLGHLIPNSRQSLLNAGIRLTAPLDFIAIAKEAVQTGQPLSMIGLMLEEMLRTSGS